MSKLDYYIATFVIISEIPITESLLTPILANWYRMHFKIPISIYPLAKIDEPMSIIALAVEIPVRASKAIAGAYKAIPIYNIICILYATEAANLVA